MKPSEAWSMLTPEQQQEMHWLVVRITAHLMRLSPGRFRHVEQHTTVRKSRPVASTKTRRAEGAPTAVIAAGSILGRGPGIPVVAIWEVEEVPRDTLDKINNDYRAHPEFKKLAKGANFVPGEGPLNARAVIIGEAPGEHEDRLRRPFVGRSGNMLDTALWSAGLSRPEVYITNVIKWRPAGNRTPNAAEVAEAVPFLRREVKAVLPRGGTVVLLGSVALSLVDEERRVTRDHGEPFSNGRWTFIPLFHPAYVMRDYDRKREVWRADWLRVKAVLEEAAES